MAVVKRYVIQHKDGRYVMETGSTPDLQAAKVYKYLSNSTKVNFKCIEVAIVPVVHVDAAIVDELDELNARHA